MRTSGISMPALFGAVLPSDVRSDIQILPCPAAEKNGTGISMKNPCDALAYGGASSAVVLFAFSTGQSFGNVSQTTVVSAVDKFVIHNFAAHCVPNAPGSEPGLIGTSTDKCPDGFANE